jgi:predicted RNase H-like nuclease (RuvC/YqgF family)
MPIQFDNFDQQKIDRLKNHLTTMASKGKAKHYEIYVDALKAVPKTDEPSEFDGYEDYMTPDTEQVKITIYNTALSPRNDQYVFVLRARNREEAVTQGLSSLPVSSFSSKSSISEWRDNLGRKEALNSEIVALKRENAELRNELAESEEYADQLAAAVEAAKENANKIGGVHWGEVLSVAVEGIVRRNTHLIAQIPGASGLAGLLEKDNSRPAELNQENKEVSFKKKENTSSEPALTPQEKEFIGLFHELNKHFAPDEIGQIIGLLDSMSKDKSLLNDVLEYIEGEPEEEQETKTTEV